MLSAVDAPATPNAKADSLFQVRLVATDDVHYHDRITGH